METNKGEDMSNNNSTNGKELAWIIAGSLVLVFVGMMAIRWFSSATTPVTVIEPEKGVHCAKMVTGDGAAISCWKVGV